MNVVIFMIIVRRLADHICMEMQSTPYTHKRI